MIFIKKYWGMFKGPQETVRDNKSSSYPVFEHGTKIRTGITCKKISCYMHDSACRWLIVKNVKIFRSYVKHF